MDKINVYDECPRCGKMTDMTYPAISRRDNRTHICSNCGVEEAMEDFKNRKE